MNLPNKHCHVVYLVISRVTIGRERGTHVGRRKMHAGFWRGDLKKKDNLEDLEVSVRIILKRILEK